MECILLLCSGLEFSRIQPEVQTDFDEAVGNDRERIEQLDPKTDVESPHYEDKYTGSHDSVIYSAFNEKSKWQDQPCM